MHRTAVRMPVDSRNAVNNQAILNFLFFMACGGSWDLVGFPGASWAPLGLLGFVGLPGMLGASWGLLGLIFQPPNAHC